MRCRLGVPIRHLFYRRVFDVSELNGAIDLTTPKSPHKEAPADELVVNGLLPPSRASHLDDTCNYGQALFDVPRRATGNFAPPCLGRNQGGKLTFTQAPLTLTLCVFSARSLATRRSQRPPLSQRLVAALRPSTQTRTSPQTSPPRSSTSTRLSSHPVAPSPPGPSPPSPPA